MTGSANEKQLIGAVSQELDDANRQEAIAPACLHVARDVGEHELLYEWAGEDEVTVWVRDAGTAGWAFYAYIVRRADERPRGRDSLGHGVRDLDLYGG